MVYRLIGVSQGAFIMVHALDEVGRVSDGELFDRVERLVKADRSLGAKLIVHLGEVEARDLHRARSYSTMFEYCRTGLGMSDAEAALRILAARVGRKFPLVVERLGAGALNLTTIRLIAPHLTAENHVQLLDRVRGMTKRRVEVVIAELAPKPDVPARMRKLPEPRAQREANTAVTNAAPCSSAPAAVAASTPPETAAVSLPTAQSASQAAAGTPAFALQPTAAPAFTLRPRRARATITPLSPGRFDLRLTLGQEAHDALEQLVELLRHQNPTGDVACIVERALCELLKREMKRRFGQTNAAEQQCTRGPARAAEPHVDTNSDVKAKATSDGAPTIDRPSVETRTRGAVKSAKSRYIPRNVLREVHARDMGQCTFVSEDGRRCTERGFLEVHHHNTTFARGGEATAANLRIMCKSHNMLLAQQDYGRTFMQEKLREAAARKQLSLVPEPVQR